MKNSVKTLLMAAAMTGLLGAGVPIARASEKPATTSTKEAKHVKAKKAKTTKASHKKMATSKSAKSKDKNSCKSANGCSGKQ